MDVRQLRTLVAAHLDAAPAIDDPVQAALDAVPADIAARVFSRPLKPAAVLIPLVDQSVGLSVLLTQRTDHLKDHPGQISFPGGRVEATDAGPVAAALRESTEEIGLPAEHVDVLGSLDPHAVVTGFAVTPVVGIVTDAFERRLDAFEVAEVFEVPLAFFLDTTNRRAQTREVQGIRFATVEYRYEDRRIWGATAGMIDAFIKILVETDV